MITPPSSLLKSPKSRLDSAISDDDHQTPYPSRAALPKVLLAYQDYGAMGGIERYLLQTATWLGEQGHYEPVLACTQDSPLYHQLQATGLKVYGLPNHPIFAKSILRTLDIFTLLALYKILQAEKPTLVHVHIGLVENLLFQAFGYPVVYTFHGYSTLYSKQSVTSPLKRLFKALTSRLFQKTARGIDSLLFVSQAEQERMLAEGYLNAEYNGQVLHNGLPIDQWQQAVASTDTHAFRRSLGLPEDARCISFINRLDDNKNPLQFIELARRLTAQSVQNTASNLHFLIAGDGPLASEISEVCQTMPNVHFLGHRPDVAKLLAITDLLIYPARREGFGLGLVEAMAAGVPSIAYASGGASEILDTLETRHCLVPIGDVDALTEKAHAFLNRAPQEQQSLKVALQARAHDFDKASFIQELTTVYRTVAPKVSVILPVYNGEAIVLRAVHSVLNQTYQNLELIVVDDGSQDQTLAVLANVQDSRLTIIPQPNQGVAKARNHGFEYATGEYIAFIDADDIWLKHKLETELKLVKQHGHVECLVYSSYYAVDEQDRLINLPGIYRENGDLSQAVLEHEGIFLPSTALIHRSVFETLGGFKPACYHEDRVFFIEACRRFPAYSTQKRLVAYRQSVSGRCRSVLKDYEQALTAELSIVETLQSTLSNDEIAALSIRQMRNLLYRFLMYNYTQQAQRLYERIQAQGVPSDLFSGKKGQLALLSLKSNINFLAGARLLFQCVTKHVLNPYLNPCRHWTLKSHIQMPVEPHSKRR